ncbi:ammonium transporter [Thiomicrorhabdus indica]|uniref:ammonium transporter n=1 Tax=Thiomicrorhabdus indica TaxID=2267253 RepID=UPI002AA6E935|nr:ammonium transporter [Thiomicrorhabdus indica]
MDLGLIDTLWILISAVLVALMQPGFTALEAGQTRAKNSISTAIKNISDFLIALMIFVTIGASLMLGNSLNGWVGWDSLFFYEDNFSEIVFILFQAMFASTAVTIISGSIAERTRYPTYLLIAVLISLFIYPIQAHWSWNQDGWLAQLGFIDFAGSTVVHSVGGWAALAAIMIIGPRLGRFNRTQNFEKSNLAMSALGIFLIWLGWIGFNGGSVLALNHETGKVILNTLVAGSMGGLSGLIYSRYKYGFYEVDSIMHGILAGLVCITASANLTSTLESVAIGSLGFFSYEIGRVLLIHWKIDDAIDAIPVHLFAGISGTLAVAFFVPNAPFLEQLQIQLIGIFVVGLYAFTVTYLFLKIANNFMPLRASEANEIIGMNISEHKASNSMHDLVQMMNLQANSKDFTQRISVEPYSEAALIAEFYNNVTRAFNQLTDENQRLIDEAAYRANYDQLTGLAKRNILFTEIERLLAHADNLPFLHGLLFIDLDGFKKANDTYGHDAGDEILKVVAQRIQAMIHQEDTAARFGGDEFVILIENIVSENQAAHITEQLMKSIRQPITTTQGQTICVDSSIGLKLFEPNCSIGVEELLKEADSAMYSAKKRGKGTWVLA